MGLDLEWAEIPEAVRTAAANAHGYRPYEFRYRHLHSIRENMLLTGMAYEAEPSDIDISMHDADSATRRRYDEASLKVRSRTHPGMVGIPTFKTSGNDGWLVTVREIEEALAVYDVTSPQLRSRLESDHVWVSWLTWLRVTRRHGGFLVE